MGYWEAIAAQPRRFAPALVRAARDSGAYALDIIFPPRSLLTGRPVSEKGVEAELWTVLRFLDEPCCAACGFPFDYAVPKGSLCGACQAFPPGFDAARAAFVYNEDSRALILRFKHGGQTDGLDVFTRQMKRAGRRIFETADMLVPVPLHPRRLRKRRFNQAALLCAKLEKASGLPADYRALTRAKNTPSQGRQSASARRRNVRGAFSVPDAAKPEITGKHIVLIDDVYTTGATLSACAKTLKRAGARHVSAITLARVVKPQTLPT